MCGSVRYMTLRAWHVNWLRTSLLLFSRHPMHSFSRAATLLPVDFLSQLKCLWPCRMKVNCYTNAPLPLHPHISGHCRMRSFTFHFRSLLALRQATPWSLGKMGWFPYVAAASWLQRHTTHLGLLVFLSKMKNSLPCSSLVGKCNTLHCITTEIVLEFIQGLLW